MDMAQVDQFETYLLQLINNERTKVGAAALAFDPELVNAAERHSTRMDDLNFFAHEDPVDGSSVGTRATDAGYGWRGVGENIAHIDGSNAAVLDNSDVERLHTNLMNSSGHRANILRAEYKEIGLAFDVGDHNGRPAIFLTEVFGLPTSAEFAETDIWG
jgi:uncharacterized protein YkwD